MINPVTLTIRKVPAKVYTELNRQAEKIGCSREEYIRQLLETHTMSDVTAFEVNKYKELVDKMLIVVENNSNLFRELIPMVDAYVYGEVKEPSSDNERGEEHG